MVLRRLKNILTNENVNYMTHTNEKIKKLHSDYNDLFNTKLNESAKFENGDNSALLLDHIQTLAYIGNNSENNNSLNMSTINHKSNDLRKRSPGNLGKNTSFSQEKEKLEKNIKLSMRMKSPPLTNYDYIKAKIYGLTALTNSENDVSQDVNQNLNPKRRNSFSNLNLSKINQNKSINEELNFSTKKEIEDLAPKQLQSARSTKREQELKNYINNVIIGQPSPTQFGQGGNVKNISNVPSNVSPISEVKYLRKNRSGKKLQTVQVDKKNEVYFSPNPILNTSINNNNTSSIGSNYLSTQPNPSTSTKIKKHLGGYSAVNTQSSYSIVLANRKNKLIAAQSQKNLLLKKSNSFVNQHRVFNTQTSFKAIKEVAKKPISSWVRPNKSKSKSKSKYDYVEPKYLSFLDKNKPSNKSSSNLAVKRNFLNPPTKFPVILEKPKPKISLHKGMVSLKSNKDFSNLSQKFYHMEKQMEADRMERLKREKRDKIENDKILKQEINEMEFQYRKQKELERDQLSIEKIEFEMRQEEEKKVRKIQLEIEYQEKKEKLESMKNSYRQKVCLEEKLKRQLNETQERLKQEAEKSSKFEKLYLEERYKSSIIANDYDRVKEGETKEKKDSLEKEELERVAREQLKLKQVCYCG